MPLLHCAACTHSLQRKHTAGRVELALARADLHSSLQARGSRLLVLRGKPEEELPCVWRAWGTTQLCFEVDTEEYARTRDKRVFALAAEAGAAPRSPACRSSALPCAALRLST